MIHIVWKMRLLPALRAENEAGRGRGRGTDVKTVSTLKKKIETLQTTIEELREIITEQEARLKRKQPASPPAPEPKRAKTTTADNSTNDMSANAFFQQLLTNTIMTSKQQLAMAAIQKMNTIDSGCLSTILNDKPS